MFGHVFIFHFLYPWGRHSGYVQRLSILDTTVKQQKEVDDYVLGEGADSHNGWAGAKMCSEAQKDLTRATVWSEIDWSSRNEGVGKEKKKKKQS